MEAYRVKDALAKVQADYVVLDCPPTLGPLTTNALVAADFVVVPVAPAFFGLSAVQDITETVGVLGKRLNEHLRILGILITMYARTKMADDVVARLEDQYGSLLFGTRITRSVRLDEAASAQQPVFNYDARSTSAKEYRALVEEVLERVRQI